MGAAQALGLGHLEMRGIGKVLQLKAPQVSIHPSRPPSRAPLDPRTIFQERPRSDLRRNRDVTFPELFADRYSDHLDNRNRFFCAERASPCTDYQRRINGSGVNIESENVFTLSR